MTKKRARMNDEVVRQVLVELSNARQKFDAWPEDPLHAVAVVNEELGELTQAILDWVYHDGEKYHIETEAVQLAAMALRFLANVDRYSPWECQQIPDSDRF